MRCALLLALAMALAEPALMHSQQAPAAEDPVAAPPPPQGKVLFSRGSDSTDADAPEDSVVPAKPAAAKEDDSVVVTDAEREALTFTAYDLDVHLKPAASRIAVRAVLTVRNDGPTPLTRLALQITSSTHWEAFSKRGPGASTPLSFVVHRVDTDADHTGQVEEAVVTLPQSLAPGASLELTALYSGTIAASAERLERIGAPPTEALAADWDAVATDGTALRGFGNVEWYPVSAAPVFLGDGTKLFDAVGRAKLRQAGAKAQLRLVVEYVGDPPDAAYFCRRREPLKAVSDNQDLPAAEAPGVATVDFASASLGFRTLDLFVTDRAATAAGEDAGLVMAVTGHYDALPSYAAAAELVRPLLADWLGAQPLGPLMVIDHPGQPFEDDALLVRPMRAADADTLAPTLAHALTHAWFHSARPWIDEGLAQFMSLLWTERSQGRAEALAELAEASKSIAQAERGGAASPTGGDFSSSAASAAPAVSGQSLIEASDEVFYRTKSAAVWWMLRGMVGDDALKLALQAYRLDTKLDADPQGLEQALEKTSHKDLRWFFDDWVYRDRGLPDLSIANVAPRQIEGRGGKGDGWLVAVDVRNDGDAAAEVPLTIRSGSGATAATVTQRIRVPARSNVSTRIVVAETPTEVLVNDGSVPEMRVTSHSRTLVATQQR